MVGIPFAKLQGAGNGYVVADGRGLALDWPAFARRICDVHTGVGSDGLAVVAASASAPVAMRIWNSDGSSSEMSGNGIRLFARFVLERGLAAPDETGALRIETGGGVRRVELRGRDGEAWWLRVAMGEPELRPAHVPVDARAVGESGPVLAHPLEVAGRVVRLAFLAIGNPHAVAILDEPVEEFPLGAVGPLVMAHPIFPNRINFEIVNVLDRRTLRVRIYERGEGETLASGTGSTASVIAARLAGRVGDDVRVRLRGGELRVHWDGRGEAFLEGPAVEVFSGVWPERSAAAAPRARG